MENFFLGRTAMTTSLNPSLPSLILIQDLLSIFPKARYFKRKKFKIRQIVYYLKVRNFKNLLVVKEGKGIEKELWQINLRKNLTVHFEITSVLLRKNLGIKGNRTFHEPELILNNFKGRIGNIIANLFKNLFSNRPNFKGRQVVTFHFERSFIFIRFHRYVFSVSREDVNIQELGPRVTLRFLNFYNNLAEKML